MVMVNSFVQLIISGLAVGCVYILIAHSINIIYACSGVLNFAQGEMVMVGALIVLTLTSTLKIPLLAALMLGIPIVGLMGAVFYFTAVMPVEHHKGSMAWLLSTLGMAIILGEGANFIWGKAPKGFPPLLSGSSVQIFGAYITHQEILIILAALSIMVFYELFLRKTMIGRAIKAVSLSHKLSKLMGINVRNIVTVCYGLGAILAAFAGCLLGPLIYIHTGLGFMLALKGFAVVIIGGLGSSFGAVIAGLLIGVVESLTAGYISGAVADSMVFLILIISLLLRPTGLFGMRILERE